MEGTYYHATVLGGTGMGDRSDPVRSLDLTAKYKCTPCGMRIANEAEFQLRPSSYGSQIKSIADGESPGSMVHAWWGHKSRSSRHVRLKARAGIDPRSITTLPQPQPVYWWVGLQGNVCHRCRRSWLKERRRIKRMFASSMTEAQISTWVGSVKTRDPNMFSAWGVSLWVLKNPPCPTRVVSWIEIVWNLHKMVSP
jgi:hypothetical protein